MPVPFVPSGTGKSLSCRCTSGPRSRIRAGHNVLLAGTLYYYYWKLTLPGNQIDCSALEVVKHAHREQPAGREHVCRTVDRRVLADAIVKAGEHHEIKLATGVGLVRHGQFQGLDAAVCAAEKGMEALICWTNSVRQIELFK
jgi:hypothetical protein